MFRKLWFDAFFGWGKYSKQTKINMNKRNWNEKKIESRKKCININSNVEWRKKSKKQNDQVNYSNIALCWSARVFTSNQVFRINIKHMHIYYLQLCNFFSLLYSCSLLSSLLNSSSLRCVLVSNKMFFISLLFLVSCSFLFVAFRTHLNLFIHCSFLFSFYILVVFNSSWVRKKIVLIFSNFVSVFRFLPVWQEFFFPFQLLNILSILIFFQRFFGFTIRCVCTLEVLPCIVSM